MKLNKEKFLKTKFGSSMMECVIAWNHWIDQTSDVIQHPEHEEYIRTIKAVYWCQAQWEVYQMAVKQFYGIEYFMTRTDEYFGICTSDESDWLLKIEREGKI